MSFIRKRFPSIGGNMNPIKKKRGLGRDERRCASKPQFSKKKNRWNYDFIFPPHTHHIWGPVAQVKETVHFFCLLQDCFFQFGFG